MKKWLSIFLVLAFLLIPLQVMSNDDVRSGIFVPLPRGVSVSDKTVNLFLKWVDYGELTQIFSQLSMFSYNKISIDLFSFGGSVFDALAIIGLLEDQERQGKTIEIRARGIVASAGLIIMMSGTRGHRYIDKHTYVMFHEIQTFKFFSVESVSDQEEQAKINRSIQNSINKYVTSKTKLTAEKLHELIVKKELWVDAQMAVEYGFADQILGN